MTEGELVSILHSVTAEGTQDHEAAKGAARGALGVEIARSSAPDAGDATRRTTISRRGLAVIAAALMIPAGIAAAEELSDSSPEVRDAQGNPVDVVPADCPELSAALADAGIPAEPVFFGECPTGEALDSLIEDIERSEARQRGPTGSPSSGSDDVP